MWKKTNGTNNGNCMLSLFGHHVICANTHTLRKHTQQSSSGPAGRWSSCASDIDWDNDVSFIKCVSLIPPPTLSIFGILPLKSQVREKNCAPACYSLKLVIQMSLINDNQYEYHYISTAQCALLCKCNVWFNVQYAVYTVLYITPTLIYLYFILHYIQCTYVPSHTMTSHHFLNIFITLVPLI